MYILTGRFLLFSLLVLLSFTGCQPSESPAEEGTKTVALEDKTQGTRQMRDSIQMIIARTNFARHPYETNRKLAVVEPQIQAAIQQNKITSQQYIVYGEMLLEAGRSQEAIEVFENLLNYFPENKKIVRQNKGLHEALALSYLRLGEQQNCVANHTEASCIFPIQGDGIHQLRTGSESAIVIYENILKAIPDDIRTRWLLNLAYMTVGKYPDEVPPRWLIDPANFAPKQLIPTFKNTAMHLGLDINDLAGGVILDDFNNDGRIDLIASSWDMDGSVRYFVNQGDGTFADQTRAAGLDQVVGGLNLVQADYNNDGFLDFYILRSAWSTYAFMGQLPNSLLKNNGDGTFSDVTIAAGIYATAPSQAAVWTDLNADGWLDLVVSNETVSPEEQHPCQVFVSQKDGTFRDVASQAGVVVNDFIKGLTAGDVNNDGLPDLYFSSLNGDNKLFLNQTNLKTKELKFEEISRVAGVQEPESSFPTWFFDYDNDGDEDLFVVNFDRYLFKEQTVEVAADYLGQPTRGGYPRLYNNQGDGTFKDVAPAVGLDHMLPAMGCNFGDLDNDGFPDFYLSTGAPDFRAIVPNRMFKNQQGKSFVDVTYDGGFGHIQKGHGISFADVDNDGDQDIYAVMGGSVSGDVFQNAFFENPGNNNSWLTLRLRGTRSNRSAIGAKIKLEVNYPDGTSQTFYQTVNSGGSFGANSLQAEMGLGANAASANLRIDWPDGQVGYTDYGSVVLNGIVQVEEGKQELMPVQQNKIDLVRSGGSHEHHEH